MFYNSPGFANNLFYARMVQLVFQFWSLRETLQFVFGSQYLLISEHRTPLPTEYIFFFLEIFAPCKGIALHNLNWLLHLCWSEPERKLYIAQLPHIYDFHLFITSKLKLWINTERGCLRQISTTVVDGMPGHCKYIYWHLHSSNAYRVGKKLYQKVGLCSLIKRKHEKSRRTTWRRRDSLEF